MPDIESAGAANGYRPAAAPDAGHHPGLRKATWTGEHAHGRWLLDQSLQGRTWFPLDEGEGGPSRWITLLALRVLRWWDGGQAAR